MITDLRAYMNARFDQLAAAIERGDGQAAADVLEGLAVDGFPELADEITRALIARGLRRLADRIDPVRPPQNEPGS